MSWTPRPAAQLATQGPFFLLQEQHTVGANETFHFLLERSGALKERLLLEADQSTGAMWTERDPI